VEFYFTLVIIAHSVVIYLFTHLREMGNINQYPTCYHQLSKSSPNWPEVETSLSSIVNAKNCQPVSCSWDTSRGYDGLLILTQYFPIDIDKPPKSQEAVLGRE
jgi:hypothetical protein